MDERVEIVWQMNDVWTDKVILKKRPVMERRS